MINPPANSDAVPTADIDSVASLFRQEIQSRLMRLLPVIFVALISLTIVQDAPRFSWSLLLQTLTCIVMVAAYLLRTKLSIPKRAVIVVACLYIWGISAASVLGLLPSSALGTTLALVVLQIVLGCKRRYIGKLAAVASYLGIGALTFVYLSDTGGTWTAGNASSLAPLLPWILISVSFACFAFIVIMEAEKMLQQLSVSQQMDPLLIGNGLRDKCNDTSDATQALASDVECDNRRLRAVNRNLEMITYALSHDLRAPLRTIEGFSRALSEDLGSSISERAKHDVREIRAGVDRMQRMVTQWLSFIRGDQTGVHREQVDLSELAREVAVELRGANPERKTVFRIEPGLTGYGDAQLLRELLQNLLGNAWKFTKKNDSHAVIEVGVHANEQQATYFVRDNGEGFAAVDAGKLFTPFVRLHSGREYEGTGVGLAIARKIVDSHGGLIWAEGQSSVGATFSFTLTQPAATNDSGVRQNTYESCAALTTRCASNRQ